MPRPSARDWAALLVLALMWGTAFAAIDVALEGVPPLTLVAGRLAIAALVLLGVIGVLGMPLPRSALWWRRYTLLAIVGNALPFTLVSLGQERVSSGLAGLLMGVMPLGTLVIAHAALPDERITPRKALGFVLGLLGIGVLVGPDALRELAGDSSALVYKAAILGAALCYATNAVITRRIPEQHPLLISAGVMVAATALMLPLALVWDRPWTLAAGPLPLAAVGWLGVVTTALATILYFRIIAAAGATFLSTINYIVPLIALATGAAFLAEEVAPSALAALGLILAGIGLSQTGGGVAAGR